MKLPNRLPCLAVFAVFGFGPVAFGQQFARTDAPADNWIALASSADGTKVVGAASYGWLYISTNSGTTWTAASTAQSGAEPQRPWTGLACSADGTTLAAVANFLPVFTSTNGGQTWHQTGPSGVWSAVAMSGDGVHITAADHNGTISLSTDSGRTWSSSTAPAHRWRSLTCSADGTTLFAGSDLGTNYGQPAAIYVSKNAGATWISAEAPSQAWQALACSADGTRAVAGAYGGPVLLTADSGASWKAAALPTRRWGGVTSSGDGRRLVVACWEGDIYVSSDSGQSWRPEQAPAASWVPVASSADGIQVFLGIWDTSGGGIYKAQFPPVLQIKPSASGTVVSWAAPATGYSLQQNLDFGSAHWSMVSSPPSVVGGENQVVCPPASGGSAYRLVRTEALTDLSAPVAGAVPLTAAPIAPGGS